MLERVGRLRQTAAIRTWSRALTQVDIRTNHAAANLALDAVPGRPCIKGRRKAACKLADRSVNGKPTALQFGRPGSMSRARAGYR